MKKLPTHIDLMGKKIPVVREDLKDAYAMFWPGKMSISISNNCPEHLLEAALLHELCHAVFEISGLTQLLELQLEEAVCSALENLAAVYKPKAGK